MKEASVDRRIRKTKRLLRKSLTSLLAEKPLAEITIKELTERADVNRGTFYYHYKDIFDLKNQIELEMFQEFLDVINSYDTDSLQQGLKPLITDVFRFLLRNADFGLMLISSKTDSLFLTWVREEIYRRGLAEWKKLCRFDNSGQWDYYLDFVVAGCIAMLQSWGQKGMRETPEEMAELFEQFILHGLSIN